MRDSLRSPVAVVAHDAGAANHIIAWLKRGDCSGIRAHLAGPALSLWKREMPLHQFRDVEHALADARTLISGTGWGSRLEHDARKLARRLAVTSIAVVDHWINYRDRFRRDGEEVLPDVIWVVDAFAKALAEKEFPSVTVIQKSNLYVESLVAEVRRRELVPSSRTGANILYVLEPIREAWPTGANAGEFQALDYFAGRLGDLALPRQPTIRLRLHPSEPPGKYDDWLKRHKGLHASIDDSTSLAEAIAWSDTVIGCQSYAMVVALAAGKRVLSSLPPWAPECALPQPEIARLAKLARGSS